LPALRCCPDGSAYVEGEGGPLLSATLPLVQYGSGLRSTVGLDVLATWDPLVGVIISLNQYWGKSTTAGVTGFRLSPGWSAVLLRSHAGLRGGVEQGRIHDQVGDRDRRLVLARVKGHYRVEVSVYAS